MVKGKENKPVVLQVLPELEMGGVEIGTVEIAGGMQKHGITNFVASQGGRLVYDLEKIRVGHLTLPLKTKNIFKMQQKRRQAGAVYQGKRHQHRARPFARTGLERLLGGKESRRPLHDHVSRHLRTRPLGTEKAL